MAKRVFGVDVDFDSNALLNKGEESVASGAIITPPAIALATNNYNPANLQTASLIRISSTVGVAVTGITAPNTARNKVLTIINVGAFNVTLTDASALSLAVNRFNMSGSVLLQPNEGVILIYDQLQSRWVAIGRAN